MWKFIPNKETNFPTLGFKPNVPPDVKQKKTLKGMRNNSQINCHKINNKSLPKYLRGFKYL